MRFAKILVLAAALSGTALADRVMTFNVEGQNPDGTAYGGTVTVEEMAAEGVGKGDRFKVTWNTGGGAVTGIGVVDGGNRKILAVAYAYEGRAGIALMTQGDGAARGVWTMEGAPGLGAETWTPVP